MRGGRREGAGRPRGGGTGKTVLTRCVSMLPATWQVIDQMRDTSSRGVFLSACVFQRFNASRGSIFISLRERSFFSSASNEVERFA